MDLKKIQSELEAFEKDYFLGVETSLEARVKALDFTEYIDEIVCVGGGKRELMSLQQRSSSLRGVLNAINEHLFQKLRTKIQKVNYTPQESCSPPSRVQFYKQCWINYAKKAVSVRLGFLAMAVVAWMLLSSLG